MYKCLFEHVFSSLKYGIARECLVMQLKPFQGTVGLFSPQLWLTFLTSNGHMESHGQFEMEGILQAAERLSELA